MHKMRCQNTPKTAKAVFLDWLSRRSLPDTAKRRKREVENAKPGSLSCKYRKCRRTGYLVRSYQSNSIANASRDRRK